MKKLIIFAMLLLFAGCEYDEMGRHDRDRHDRDRQEHGPAQHNDGPGRDR